MKTNLHILMAIGTKLSIKQRIISENINQQSYVILSYWHIIISTKEED